MLTGHYLARYVKLRELMLESAGEKANPRQEASRIPLADKELVYPGHAFPDRREGWKCKERARLQIS